MSTSAKFKEFIAEPMGEKEVTAIAGIGDTYGKKLAEKGYDKAYVLLGQFLLLKKDKELFIDWLKEEADVAPNHGKNTADCLQGWIDQFM